MACVSGTNIVNDGLVFHFDLENGVKSWKGKPTSNIILGAPIISGMRSIVPAFVEFENGWKKYSISGTWNAGTYPFSMRINGAVFTGGVAYSSRCLLKTNVREKYASFGGLNYVNDPNMQSRGVATTTSLGFDEDGLEIIESKREGFIYSTGYANPTTSQVGYLNSRPISNGTVFNPDTDFVWVKEIQVEEGNFCTKYVNGVRLDTASIIDLSPNKNTITAANLTYRQDDTPTFDGADDYLNIAPQSIPANSSLSLSVWINTSSVRASSVIEAENFVGGRTLNVHIPWSDNTVYFDCGGANGSTSYDRITYATTVEQRTGWHNWVFTKDISANEMRIYADGNLVAFTGNKNIIPGPTQFATIGSYVNGASNFYNGEISQVKIYDKALTAQEVKQNFEATRTRYGI